VRKGPKRTVPMIKDMIANFVLFIGNAGASAVVKKVGFFLVDVLRVAINPNQEPFFAEK